MVSNDDSKGTRVGEQTVLAPSLQGIGKGFPMRDSTGPSDDISKRYGKKTTPKVAPGAEISTSSHLDITPSPPLVSFIFIPSRDLTSLRGASIDTFRYFPLVNSE